jgi:DNA repair exonuclease SbcCD ATPase subunit
MDKRIKKPIGHFFMFVIIVFLIAIIFITVGWAANKLLEEDKPLTLEDKKKCLKVVEEKLVELQNKKEELKSRERRILLVSRLFIAFSLLLANYFYMNYYKLPFDFKRSSNEVLRFNSLILLVYSFVAFISYGTPAKFVDSLKSLITSLLQKFSIETYSHFEKLLEERKVLMAEIELEEKQLSEPKKKFAFTV